MFEKKLDEFMKAKGIHSFSGQILKDTIQTDVDEIFNEMKVCI